jgi:hypothetical protein
VINLEEIAAVKARYPHLLFFQERAAEGFIDIHANFNGEERKDRFQIRIDFPAHEGAIPSLEETGARTAAIAQKYGIKDLQDLHRNPSGTACLCAKQEELKRCPPGSELLHFIEVLVVPYLFWLSHFDEFGKAPWGEYSHGTFGVLEYYAEDPSLPSEATIKATLLLIVNDGNWREYRRQIRRPRPRRACICNSGRRIAKCHELGFAGISKLHCDIKALGLERLIPP